MSFNSLDEFSTALHSAWGPLSTDLVWESRWRLEALAKSPSSEPWLADLHARRPANHELYRDPDHGFVLLAHAEYAGLYRPPHDHGRAWVVYGLQEGEIEMRTFVRLVDGAGHVRLVQRDATVLRAGQAAAYLPGDIHDTRCLSQNALLFRFAERDLKVEDRVDHQVTRYPAPERSWTSGQ